MKFSVRRCVAIRLIEGCISFGTASQVWYHGQLSRADAELLLLTVMLSVVDTPGCRNEDILYLAWHRERLPYPTKSE